MAVAMTKIIAIHDKQKTTYLASFPEISHKQIIYNQ